MQRLNCGEKGRGWMSRISPEFVLLLYVDLLADQPVTMTYPGGEIVITAYDELNRLTS